MDECIKTIIENFRIRNRKKQKNDFIEFIKSEYQDVKVVEYKNMLKSKNLVFGDIPNAKVVLTAHYDTPARLPFPNFIAPKNICISLLYQFVLSIVILFIFIYLSGLISLGVDTILFNLNIPNKTLDTISAFTNLFIFFLIGGLIFWFLLIGIPNKNNYNDNTSGVVTICNLIKSLPDNLKDKVAFVLFDNEEQGLIGSRQFLKMNKEFMKDKLLINFDCVGEGNNIMFVLNKRAKNSYLGALQSSASCVNKNVLYANSRTTLYPSDQSGFKNSIAVCSLKHNKFLGYYMNKIHTNKDVTLDYGNIYCLEKIMINFIEKI